MQIAWDANTETDLAGYRVYSGAKLDQYIDTLDVGLLTHATLKVPPGTTVYAVVTAYNLAGMESDPSNAVSARVVRVTAERADAVNGPWIAFGFWDVVAVGREFYRLKSPE